LVVACVAGDKAARGHYYLLVDGPVAQWLRRRDKAPAALIETAIFDLYDHLLQASTKGPNAGQVRLATYRGRGPLEALLRTAACRCLGTLLRVWERHRQQGERSFRQSIDPQLLEQCGANPAELAARSELVPLRQGFEDLIKQALQGMPDQRRLVAQLRLYRGWRNCDIAQFKKVTGVAVWQHLKAARDDVHRHVTRSPFCAELALGLGLELHDAEALVHREVDRWFDTEAGNSPNATPGDDSHDAA